MMNGWDGGMSTGGWILMTVFWVALIVLIVWAIMQLLPGRRESTPPPADAEDDPQTILARRLARGEIDPDTYDDLRRRLAGRDSTPAGVH